MLFSHSQTPCGTPPHQPCSRLWGCPIQKTQGLLCWSQRLPHQPDPRGASEGPPAVPAPGALQRPGQNLQLSGVDRLPTAVLSLQARELSPGPVLAGGWPLPTRLCPARLTPSLPVPRKTYPLSPNLTLAKPYPSSLSCGESFLAVLKY